MLVIPFVPSDAPTLTSSVFRLSAHHLALTALASQPLKSGTLSLYLSVPVPVLIPFVVTSRPTTASRPSTPLNTSLLAPQIRLLLTTVHINKLYLLAYLRKLFTSGITYFFALVRRPKCKTTETQRDTFTLEIARWLYDYYYDYYY